MFTYQIPVRYSECDVQGVVFNAHYLAYCDHAMDEFLRAAVGDDSDFELMVRSAQITWQKALRYRDRADVACEVSRWGTTSMDVTFVGSVDDEMRFEAVLTYVAVTSEDGTMTPRAIPPTVRNGFERAAG